MIGLARHTPPAGERIRARVAEPPDPNRLPRVLAEQQRALRVDLFCSGREALRRGLATLAQRSGRDEAVLPAYTCPSVAAAAVAARLRVRLVDVAEDGAIDPARLSALPLERCAALVVCNLFGRAEPIAVIRAIAQRFDVPLVDDAAQAFGAVGPDGLAGSRGALGVLSFARGKPLGALGGGALLWYVTPDESAPPVPRGGGWRARAAAHAHDLALHDLVFPWLARAPFLHVGETRFDPVFRRGAIDPAAACLTSGLLSGAEAARRSRAGRLRRIAERIARETAFRPLVPPASERWAAARLSLLAPSAAARDAAVSALARRGASRLYPRALDQLEALAPHRSDRIAHPEARRIAATLLTLPPSLPSDGETCDTLVESLARAGSGAGSGSARARAC